MQVRTRMEVAEATPPPPTRQASKIRNKRLRTSLLFMAPAFIIILIFMIGPAIWAIYTSFTNMALTGVGAQAPDWVGLQNFTRILRDGEFLNSFRVSLTYLVGSALIGQAGLGLLLALMMQKRNRVFRGILGAIIIACWVIPDVVAGFIWQAFLAGGPQSVLSSGLLNTVMANLTLPQHAWVQEYPLPMIIIANIWRGTAFSMLLYSSALESIPQDMYEAAAIDGAGLWAKITNITLPLIKGSIATDLLLITLATLSDFTLVYIMTGGSTSNNELLTIYQYRQAFQFYQIGYGSAIALLIIVFGAILSLIYIRILRVDI
ncbi:carbohydrate ABC transporter permease [Ktedonospora formicarum]|uniref:Amino acid ABC transporter permease n=1 Tax=Ktedonospora formicarum TaxID=2778364 RepID=A0A8J3I1K4_9CHLR|nr:sugar ABC transporter permease [Ktedonospora formicarum]GHO45008.1 amino acid ABC transporter permease [Ktedonospora formicarum]